MTQIAQHILKGIVGLLVVWVVGLCFFCFSIPSHVQDSSTPTEAVVVLTGGRERLKTGFELLCSNQTQKIFISGVHPDGNLKSLIKIFEDSRHVCPQSQEFIAAHTYLGYEAKNTRENAVETANWVKRMSVSSVRLVTAAYHMPRSLLELKHLLPATTIIPHPVFPMGFTRLRLETFHLIVSEYHKFLWAFARIHFNIKTSANH